MPKIDIIGQWMAWALNSIISLASVFLTRVAWWRYQSNGNRFHPAIIAKLVQLWRCSKFLRCFLNMLTFTYIRDFNIISIYLFQRNSDVKIIIPQDWYKSLSWYWYWSWLSRACSSSHHSEFHPSWRPWNVFDISHGNEVRRFWTNTKFF